MGSRRQFRPRPGLEPLNLSHYAVTKLLSNAGRTESDVPFHNSSLSLPCVAVTALMSPTGLFLLAWLKRLRKSGGTCGSRLANREASRVNNSRCSGAAREHITSQVADVRA